MTPRLLLEIVGGILALAISYSYVEGREASARMEATIESQKQILAQAQSERDRHAQEDAARDAATATMIKSWQQTVTQLKTPQQQAQWSQQQLTDALRGIQITLNPKTGEAVATIPATTLPDLPAVIERCRECDLKLTTVQADLVSRQQQIELADKQIVALKTERDAAVVAAKGGTKWQRITRMVKWLAIGAGVGYVAAKTH